MKRTLAILVVAACGGGDGGIGPEGGTVVSDDGLFTLTVPAGALSNRTDIRITSTDTAELEEMIGAPLGGAYRLEPDGLVFAVPASFSMELPQEAMVSPGMLTFGSRMTWLESAGNIEPLPEQRSTVDVAGGVAEIGGTIPHFTGVALGHERNPTDVDSGSIVGVIYPEELCVGESGTIEINMQAYMEWQGFGGPAEYVNRVPPGWEIVDNESQAQLEGGMFPTSLGDDDNGSIDASATVTCTGGPGTIELLVRIEADFEHVDGPHFSRPSFTAYIGAYSIVIDCVPCENTILEGAFATAMAAEGAVRVASEMFDNLGSGVLPRFEDDTYVTIAGANGNVMHRLSDGMIVHDFRFADTPTYATIAANKSLVSVGPDGYSDRRFNESTQMFSAFAQLGLFGQNLTDVVPIRATPMGVHGLLLANNSIDRVERLDPDVPSGAGFVLRTTPVLTQAQLAGVTGQVVSIYSPAGEGPILGISDDGANPGELFWVDPANPGGLVVVGQVGAGPRRIRCLEPAGTPCAVSSYVAGTITLVDWPSRAAAPTIGGTTVAVAGPVGIDLALVAGMPTVASTGFIDDTLHLTTIGASLTPTDQTTPLPTCTDPGHVIFTPGETHVVVTCNGSDTYEAMALP